GSRWAKEPGGLGTAAARFQIAQSYMHDEVQSPKCKGRFAQKVRSSDRLGRKARVMKLPRKVGIALEFGSYYLCGHAYYLAETAKPPLGITGRGVQGASDYKVVLGTGVSGKGPRSPAARRPGDLL